MDPHRATSLAFWSLYSPREPHMALHRLGGRRAEGEGVYHRHVIYLPVGDSARNIPWKHVCWSTRMSWKTWMGQSSSGESADGVVHPHGWAHHGHH